MSGNLTPVWILAGCALALGFVLGRAFTRWQCDRRLAARIRKQLDDMRALGREEGYEEGLIDGRGDPGGTGSEEWSEEELAEMTAEHHVPPHEPPRTQEEFGFTGLRSTGLGFTGFLTEQAVKDGLHERHEPDATAGWRVGFTNTGTLSLEPPTRMSYDTALVAAFPALGKDWAA